MKPNKRRQRPNADKGERNEYYENISARLGIAQVVLYLSLFAFVVLSFIANTEMVTYQNFYRFFQDLTASAERVDIFEGDSLSYATDEEQDFVLYRGGLAVAGNTSVTVFSATGRQLLSETVQYRNPIAVGAGKYLLVYEMGGKQYSLYNSNARLYEGNAEYPISGAAVSDSGMYALVTSAERSTSSVSLYNNRFQLINRYNKDGYVTDVAIDATGKHVAILTAASQSGVLATKLMIAVPGEGEARAETELGASMGLSLAFTDSGQVAVLCRDRVLFADANGALIQTWSFDGKQLARFCVGRDGAAVVLKKNMISAKNILIVFDKNGKIVYNETVSKEIEQMDRMGNVLYAMTEGGVLRIDLASGNEQFVSCLTADRALLAVDTGEALCCSPQKAVFLSFQNENH